jgi:radical SAM protein with 4Fe4S-binding SPASM domain
MKKDTICAIPWMHLNFEPNGKVVPCCLTSTHNYFAGDLTTQSIEEIWNSDNMKSLRLQMINGEQPKICSTCFNKESVTGLSGRIHNNKAFPQVLERIPEITDETGHVSEMNLLYWDFRFSNLCNLKCRSCGPRYSSAWVPDAKKLGLISDQDKVWNIDSVDDANNFDFLTEQIGVVEKIYFAGGEPLMMDEHWQILELLDKNKRHDVKICYNTNCTTFTYKNKDVFDYWKNWNADKLEIWPSIDEIGPRAELIRSGTVWTKVENNLKRLTTLDNALIKPGITVGAWNVFRLPEIITHLVDIGVINSERHHQNFFLNLIEMPLHYNIAILPDKFKNKTRKRLVKFIGSFNKKYNTNIKEHFTQIISELSKEHNPNAAQRFVNMTAKVDNVRKEKFYDVVPELKMLKRIYPTDV